MFKKFLLLISIVSIILIPNHSFAQTPSEEQILSFDDNITVNSDSSINVSENIKYFFSEPKHGIFRYIPNKYLDKTNNKYFKTPIENISVTDENSIPYEFEKQQSGDFLELQIGDPGSKITGTHIYVIKYKVTGVINYFSDHDELYWNVTGSGWEVPIGSVTANITLPSGAQADQIKQICYTGSTGSKTQECDFNYDGAAKYNASSGPLTIVLSFNKNLVTEIPRDYVKSYRYESWWYLIIVPIFFLYLLWLYIKKGRDPFGRGTIIPEFSPPNNLKPAEIGTLIDEKADNQDISATLIDLAVRGYTKIKEKDKKFSFIALKVAGDEMSEYETKLFSSIFDGSLKEVKLTDLKSEDFANSIKDIKDLLYKRVTSLGYFLTDPSSVRNRYFIYSIVLIFFSFVFYWLSWILVSALICCALLIAIFSRAMPVKTKEGVIAKEKALGFKEFLYRADRYKLHWQEKERIFEKYLPYALVFGVVGEWSKNFASLYNNPPSWYEGNYATFNMIVFTNSINSFSSHTGSSFSPPASSGSSGFGGGGFSGGGFGGGGGGSW
jgi:uncharacterized membrane protein